FRCSRHRDVPALSGFGTHCIREVRKKIVGDFLGGAIDESLTELRKLAADLSIDIVRQKRAAVFWRELDRGAALGKAGDPAIALPGDFIAVRRVEIGQRDLA